MGDEKSTSHSLKISNRHAFDCSICLSFLTIPVFTCDNGHLVCSECCSKFGNKCNKCSIHITLKRCRTIENLLQYIEISCPNEKYGCRETISNNGQRKHEEECIYMPCYCPLSGCDFVASSEVLSNHFSHIHGNSRMQFSYARSFVVTLKSNDETVVLQEESDGKLFILNNSTMLLGNAVNISCIDPNSCKARYSYEILATMDRSKICSLKLRCFPKNVQRVTLENHSPEFLMIPFGYFGSSEPLKLEICITPKVQLRIYVASLITKMSTLRVKSTDTIANVKEKLRDEVNIPVNGQSLFFDGHVLDDNLTLASYNIQEKSTIDLRVGALGTR